MPDIMSTSRKLKAAKKSALKSPSIFQWVGVLRLSTLGLLVSLGLILATGLSVVRTTHENRFAFNKLQEMKEQANQLEVEWGQLLIEENLWAFPHRIEKDAKKLLSMRAPKPKEVEFVGLDLEDAGVNHASR